MRKNLRSNKRYHQSLKSVLPFIPVRFNQTPKFLISYQMGNFMNQSDEKSVFIQIRIHGNLVLSSYRSAIIAVSRLALVHYLQMHIVALD